MFHTNNKVSYNPKHFLPFRSKPYCALQIKGFLMLQGSLVALITPMNQDGSIHYEQLRDLIDWHIENGTDGIVARRHDRRIRHPLRRRTFKRNRRNGQTRQQARSRYRRHRRQQYCRSHRPFQSRRASRCGLHLICCSLLQQTFARRHLPTFQSHRRSHFDSDGIYNVPGRTVVSMSNDTILRLAEIPISWVSKKPAAKSAATSN